MEHRKKDLNVLVRFNLMKLTLSNIYKLRGNQQQTEKKLFNN